MNKTPMASGGMPAQANMGGAMRGQARAAAMSGRAYADGGLVEGDYDDQPLARQMPGFLPPNSCDETQGPGVRSQQDYKK